MSKKNMSITIEEDNQSKVKEFAEANNCSVSSVIDLSIEKFFDDPNRINSKKVYALLIETYSVINMIDDEELKYDLLEKVGDIICLL